MTEPNSILSISELGERWHGDFPGVHAYSTLESLENPDGRLDEALLAANALVHRWNGGQFVGMWAYGRPGTGKTHYAMGLGRALHDAGAEVAYMHVPTIMQSPEVVGNKRLTTITGFREQVHSRKQLTLPYNIFVPSFTEQQNGTNQYRDTKSVLILDEYVPAAKRVTSAAIEAAAEYGGAVIVTSNYADPFKLFEINPDSTTTQDVVLEGLAQQINPEGKATLDAARNLREGEITASLRSRLAGGFKFLEFTGPDMRIEKSFWA